VVNLFCTLDP